MTVKQRSRLRRILIDRLTDLYRTVHSGVRASMVRELFGEGEDEPRDEGDESLRTLMRDTRMRLAEVDAKRAQLMEEALRRLNGPGAGTCVDCDGDIEWKRLQAVPWAIRCVDCQEAAEFDARDHSPSL